MPNYPQLDNARGVWNMKEVYDAVMGGYWPNALSRAVMGGGETPSVVNTIDKITMSSAGDAADFGDLTVVRRLTTGLSNFTRGIWASGTPSSSGGNTSIDYVTIMSDGNAADFGDITNARYGAGGSSNSTRGLSFGGWLDPAVNNTIDYITMASTGAAADFGDLSAAKAFMGGTESTTRSVSLGGYTPTLLNVIEYVEMATLGDSIDFGDLTAANYRCTGTASSSTRGTVCGGANPGASNPHTRIEYITTASQGNSIDYADSNSAGTDKAGTSNSVRGLFMGGAEPSQINVIEYIAISAGGTALDFGDLTSARASPTAVSNSHGGLNDGYQGTRITPIPQGAGAGQRGLFGAGFTEPAAKSNVDFFTISTLGNAADFGDVSLARYATGGIASSTRSLAAGAHSPSSDVIDYAEFAHTGNYADFGNLSASRGYMEQGAASSTRGIWGGGNSPSPVGTVNIMEYVTMATIGNATDFGDLSAAKTNASSGVNNTTRGIWAGGYNPSPGDTHVNVIEYVTIATTGNASDFGDLTVARTYLWGGSNVTRGIWTGGNHPGQPSYDVMDYVTIASTGNATDFGDSATAALEAECVSNATRMVRGGGAAGPAPAYTPTTVNMDYVTIASAGDAADFGDLTVKKAGHFAGSNGHGGLS